MSAKRGIKWDAEMHRKATRAANRAKTQLGQEHPEERAAAYRAARAGNPDAPRYSATTYAFSELLRTFPERYAELYAQYKREEGLES